MPRNALQDLAADAYVYGFPLVFDLTQVMRLVRDGVGTLPPARFNTFAHARTLSGPEDAFVAVNNDVVHSVAQLDLSAGPLMLHVPPTGGAYYVLQFVDAWTNAFAYVGRRTTGTREADYLVVPPGWRGEPPPGVGVIEAPTAIASIVGRFACNGEEDLARVASLQRRLTLTPIDGRRRPRGIPPGTPGVASGLEFFERLRTWMAAFPPPKSDQAYQRRFVPLGLCDSVSPFVSPDPERAAVLRAGLRDGQRRVEEATRPAPGADPGAWRAGLHLFDYNCEHLGPGTVDSPKWRIADRDRARLVRAVAAHTDLWGNHGYEAVYAHTLTDSAGRPLDGRNSYTLRFEVPPPVEAFWSLSLYTEPEGHLVDNPIQRHSIGDRTPGLRTARDGSITVYLRHDRPSGLEADNWLPTPAGAFRPMIRLYQPHASVLDGGYRLPAITPTSPHRRGRHAGRPRPF
ncbi:DUF1254 domain-containing protein [Nocardiopsis mangrovi]|uniref:DUF1254 domain-containing protein n=1 Tax=Nocardiopsis mangrovi TaxID=1179818 RepID=A0ABV9E119_9ACTN